MDGFFGLYNHVDPPQVSFGWLNKNNMKKVFEEIGKIYLDRTVRSTESSPIWFVTNLLWFDSQMLHIWIIYLHERWKMATFKGKWLGKYSLHGASGIVLSRFPTDFEKPHLCPSGPMCNGFTMRVCICCWAWKFVSPFPRVSPHKKKNQRELGCDELAFEMDDYFPLLNLDLFSWWCFWRIGIGDPMEWKSPSFTTIWKTICLVHFFPSGIVESPVDVPPPVN